MWVLSIFGQMVSSPRMDWKGWFSQWQVAPQNLQPEHQVAVWCYHSLSETFPFKKSPKSWKLFPTCTSFVPKQLKSQSWASRGKGGEPESTMNRLRIWAGQGRGGLTGRWTSSSCRLWRSRFCRFPIGGLRPCHPADQPTIFGCPTKIPQFMIKCV